MSYFIDAIKNHYIDCAGRASRTQYWMFVLMQFIFAVVLLVLSAVTNGNILGTVFNALYIVYVLALILPAFALALRRLHDTDRSAWWILISLVPLIGSLILIVFLVLPSTPGENRFGPMPTNLK